MNKITFLIALVSIMVACNNPKSEQNPKNGTGQTASNSAAPAANPLKENLTRMKWTATAFSGFSNNNQPFGADTPELTFLADGSIEGRFCNGISGTYELKDNKIAMILIKTRMACEGNLMKAEDFLKPGEYEIDITKGYLSLVNSKGEMLTFRRETTDNENPMAN